MKRALNILFVILSAITVRVNDIFILGYVTITFNYDNSKVPYNRVCFMVQGLEILEVKNII